MQTPTALFLSLLLVAGILSYASCSETVVSDLGEPGVQETHDAADNGGFPSTLDHGASAVPNLDVGKAAVSGPGVVLPSAYATKMGIQANTYPHAQANMRYQQVFLGAELGDNRTFTELCLRLDESSGGPAQSQQLTLKLGPTSRDHTNLASFFDGNYSAPPTTVFSGTLHLPDHAGGGHVDAFDVCMPFAAPYHHVGDNLIVEMINTSASSMPHYEDFCRGRDCTTARVYAFDAAATGASNRSRNEGLVMRLVAGVETIAVGIDVVPGSERNPINTGGRGVLPVAVLGSGTFDVRDLDRATLALGPGGATPAHSKLGHLDDVNDDGYTDLVSHYRIGQTGLTVGDTEACVTGQTTDGQTFEGCDRIFVVK